MVQIKPENESRVDFSEWELDSDSEARLRDLVYEKVAGAVSECLNNYIEAYFAGDGVTVALAFEPDEMNARILRINLSELARECVDEWGDEGKEGEEWLAGVKAALEDALRIISVGLANPPKDDA